LFHHQPPASIDQPRIVHFSIHSHKYKILAVTSAPAFFHIQLRQLLIPYSLILSSFITLSKIQEVLVSKHSHLNPAVTSYILCMFCNYKSADRLYVLRHTNTQSSVNLNPTIKLTMSTNIDLISASQRRHHHRVSQPRISQHLDLHFYGSGSAPPLHCH